MELLGQRDDGLHITGDDARGYKTGDSSIHDSTRISTDVIWRLP